MNIPFKKKIQRCKLGCEKNIKISYTKFLTSLNISNFVNYSHDNSKNESYFHRGVDCMSKLRDTMNYIS